MKFNLKFNPNELSRAVVSKQLQRLGVPFAFDEMGCLLITAEITSAQRKELFEVLAAYSITLTETGKNNVVQDIKQAIEEMIFSEDIRTTKVSAYLSEKLDYSYSHLSNLFSEETYTSIENFIILRKIEYVKKLMLEGNMSLTEISHKLDYSSVAHLSGQFKKTTGLTPTVFNRILKRRKINTLNYKP